MPNHFVLFLKRFLQIVCHFKYLFIRFARQYKNCLQFIKLIFFLHIKYNMTAPYIYKHSYNVSQGHIGLFNSITFYIKKTTTDYTTPVFKRFI